MKIQQQIAGACTEYGFEAIAMDMGYANFKKGVARLDRVLKSPDLGMIKPEYDGLYSSEGFVRKLLNVLGLGQLMEIQDMRDLQALVADERYGYRPWLFVDTHFKRTGQPVFVLAILEGRRRLDLPKDLKSMSLQGQLDYLKSYIADYMDSLNAADGNASIWGKPVEFYCHLSEEHGLKLDLNGELIEDIHELIRHSGAYLSL